MDTLLFHYDSIVIPFIKKRPQFWDPAISWKNKYHIIRPWTQEDSRLKIYWLKFLTWLFINPLVFVTDGWHLCQFIFLNSMFVIISILSPYNFVLSLIMSILVFGIGFNLVYNFRNTMKTLKSILLSPLTLAFLAVIIVGTPIYFLAEKWTPLAIAAAPLTLLVLWLISKLKKK